MPCAGTGLGMVVSIFLFNLIKTLQNLPRPLTHFTDVDTEVERLNDSAEITQLVLAKEIIKGCSKWNTFCLYLLQASYMPFGLQDPLEVSLSPVYAGSY